MRKFHYQKPSEFRVCDPRAITLIQYGHKASDRVDDAGSNLASPAGARLNRNAFCDKNPELARQTSPRTASSCPL